MPGQRHQRRARRLGWAAGWCLCGLLLAAAALARTNVVTLPGRDSKNIDVVLGVRRNFAGDWSLKTDAS